MPSFIPISKSDILKTIGDIRSNISRQNLGQIQKGIPQLSIHQRWWGLCDAHNQAQSPMSFSNILQKELIYHVENAILC